jgi:hypothetical protein
MKLFFLTITLCSTSSAIAALLGEERDWEFIQSVGGIAIGTPTLINHEWLLPIECNVSGLKTITVKPTMLNSGLVWADTEVRIKDSEIHISIETALTGMGGKSSSCGPAELGTLKSGKYIIKYLSPDMSTNYIGEVDIGL